MEEDIKDFLLEIPEGDNLRDLHIWKTFWEEATVNLWKNVENKNIDSCSHIITTLRLSLRKTPRDILKPISNYINSEISFIKTTSFFLKFLEEENIYSNLKALNVAISLYVIHINLTDVNEDYCRLLCEEDEFIQATKQFIFYAYDHWDSINQEPQEMDTIQFVLMMVSVVHNIVRHPHNTQYFLCNAMQNALVQFMESTDSDLICSSTLALAYLVTDNDRKLLEHASKSIEKIILYLTSAELTEDNEERYYRGFCSTELLSALCALTIDNQVNQSFIEQGGIELLIKLSEDKDCDELLCITQILWNILFNANNRIILEEKYEISQFLQNLREEIVKNGEMPKRIIKNIDGALWQLQGDNKTESFSASKMNKSMEANEVKYDVFISYCWADKVKVLPVRESFRLKTINCWIDVEQMQGSTIDAMACGIENSTLVLLCMSEAYKVSPNCRMEAEFALALQKPIIPLIMQERYKPSGWLGFILGAKLYFDFSGRRDYNATFKQLTNNIKHQLNEIRGCVKVDKKMSVTQALPKVNNPPPPPQTTTTGIKKARNNIYSNSTLNGHRVDVDAIVSWSEAEVLDWLASEEIQLGHLQNVFQEINGQLLIELLFMRLECPQEFNLALTQHFEMSLIDRLKFCKATNQFYKLCR